jgi:predicted O-methyltransferase YrrM
MKHFYEKINGWFTFPNLYKQVVKNQKSDAHFVEVGSFLGKSSCYMAVEIINSNKNIKFDCVDIWTDGTLDYLNTNRKNRKKGSVCVERDEAYVCVERDEAYNQFIKNIENVRSIVNPIRLPSVEASKLYADNSLDFVFIDANHSYEFVKDDINAWYPKVKKGGILAGHDYIKLWSGVIQAVDEFILKHNYSLEINSEICWGFIKR